MNKSAPPDPVRNGMCNLEPANVLLVRSRFDVPSLVFSFTISSSLSRHISFRGFFISVSSGAALAVGYTLFLGRIEKELRCTCSTARTPATGQSAVAVRVARAPRRKATTCRTRTLCARGAPPLLHLH